MVYFKRDLPLPGDREPDDTYWAIGHSRRNGIDAINHKQDLPRP